VIAAPGILSEENASRLIDVPDKIIVPGGIDPHVHCRFSLPSRDSSSTLFSCPPAQVSRAALFGGTTTMIDFAFQSPGKTLQDAIERRKEDWHNQCYCDYAFHIMLQGSTPDEILQELPDVIQEGYPSVKIYTTDCTPFWPSGRMVLFGDTWEVLRISAKHGGIAAVHAEDDELVMHMYRRLNQYLMFTDSDYSRKHGQIFRTYPSLKSQPDRDALWDGIRSGTISCVATDDVCCPLSVKLAGDRVEDTTGRNSGVETRLGIMYTEMVGKRGFSLQDFVAVTSTNAARIMGLYPRKGVLAPGSDADIAVMDPHAGRTLRAEELHETDHSPWDGTRVSAWPVMTLLGEKIVVDRGVFYGDLRDGNCMKRKIAENIRSRAAV
jgi:dihydroorotase-like cyclic amidohydrolase